MVVGNLMLRLGWYAHGLYQGAWGEVLTPTEAAGEDSTRGSLLRPAVLASCWKSADGVQLYSLNNLKYIKNT